MRLAGVDMFPELPLPLTSVPLSPVSIWPERKPLKPWNLLDYPDVDPNQSRQTLPCYKRTLINS